jgi:hypothetical protein
MLHLRLLLGHIEVHVRILWRGCSRLIEEFIKHVEYFVFYGRLILLLAAVIRLRILHLGLRAVRQVSSIVGPTVISSKGVGGVLEVPIAVGLDRYVQRRGRLFFVVR